MKGGGVTKGRGTICFRRWRFVPADTKMQRRGSCVRQTCDSHGDKQLSIVSGLLVRTMRFPDETGGGGAMGEISKSRAWRKGVTVECTGVGFGARGGSKFRVGRFVRGGGVGE